LKTEVDDLLNQVLEVTKKFESLVEGKHHDMSAVDLERSAIEKLLLKIENDATAFATSLRTVLEGVPGRNDTFFSHGNIITKNKEDCAKLKQEVAALLSSLKEYIDSKVNPQKFFVNTEAQHIVTNAQYLSKQTNETIQNLQESTELKIKRLHQSVERSYDASTQMLTRIEQVDASISGKLCDCDTLFQANNSTVVRVETKLDDFRADMNTRFLRASADRNVLLSQITACRAEMVAAFAKLDDSFAMLVKRLEKLEETFRSNIASTKAFYTALNDIESRLGVIESTNCKTMQNTKLLSVLGWYDLLTGVSMEQALVGLATVACGVAVVIWNRRV